MSDTKFTPGPWVVTFRRNGSSCISMGDIASGGRHKQFDMLLCKGDGNDEADAHLIAAAPDMYAALEAVESDLSIGAHPHLHIDAIRAAIAKARGEA